MNIKQNLLIAIAATAISLSFAGGASAGTWQNNHPRRAEVNGRLDNQNFRINRDVRDGKITGVEASQLHSEDRSMRMEERADARADGGHITGAEQRALNRQENGVSHQIYNQAH
ncbi:MAG: hypothetical protein ABSD74_19165 [Rhizomicrobium sp.]